jgi:hypothetical protein
VRTRDFEPLARLVVRRYPRAWRERYEDEIVALLQTTPVAAMQVLDLVRGCVGEWRSTAINRLSHSIPVVGRGVAMTFRLVTSLVGSMLVGLPGVALAMGVAFALRTTIGDGQGGVILFQYLAWLGLISILAFVFPRFALGSLSAEERRLVRRVVGLCFVCAVLRQWGAEMRTYGNVDRVLITLADAMWLGMLIQLERGWFKPIRPPRAPEEIIQLRLSAP